MRNLLDIRVSTSIGSKTIPYAKISDFKCLTGSMGNALLCELHPFPFADNQILIIDLYSKQSTIGSSPLERKEVELFFY